MKLVANTVGTCSSAAGFISDRSTMGAEQMDGKKFEAEVLKVARHLWRKDVSGGSELVDGRERDGVFYEEDIIHLIEATIDRSEEKAKQDVKKLSKLAGDLRKVHPDKVVKCWFITKDEPTDRQRASARASNYPVHAIGFREFQARIIDAHEYIRARRNHIFGSAHNPVGDSRDLKFIPVGIKKLLSTELCSISSLANELCAGRKVSLTADYGSGKSMVLREVFAKLSDSYLSGRISQFPVHINLREHSGAQYPDEILERHARIIGFAEPTKLVRAWRAGYVILLLDGFDEITSLGFQGRWSKLRDLRFRALAAVRELITAQGPASGVIVAGREYYFDSYSELRGALGVAGALELTLNDFTEEQVRVLLANLGISVSNVAPAWLPKRPLFVATLALRGYLSDLTNTQSTSVGDSWNELVSSICTRESRISNSLDPGTIRGVLERVATIARSRDEYSSLSQADLASAFSEVCNYEPDEQGLLLLERLPGLGIVQPGSDARRFVDPDFEGALGSGDVCRYFVEPWVAGPSVSESIRPLTQVGVAVAESVLRDDGRARSAEAAFDRARGSSCLTYDLLQLARELSSTLQSPLSIQDLHIGHFDLCGSWESGVEIFFRDCIFDVLDVDSSSQFSAKVKLHGCLIRSLSGVVVRGDLPSTLLDERTDIEEFADGVTSNASILGASYALPVRVMLVVLRKLFMQKGAARRENAFFRGLDVNAQRYVGDVLDILGSEGLATRDRHRGEPLVVPNRAESHRVMAVLAAPETSQDPLLVRARGLA